MEAKDYIQSIDNAERRFLAHPVSAELRDQGEGKEARYEIRGLAAVVNSETNMGWYREMIAPGAFNDVLTDDVRALFNHDPNQILARTKAGTLRLELTPEGHLAYSYTTPNRRWALDLQDAILSGDVDQSSFAFRVKEDKWTRGASEYEPELRTITKVERLYDVSPVTYPAYQDTTVAKRSMEQHKPAAPEAPSFDPMDQHQMEYQLNINQSTQP
jgi:HK97 family phage prohead protease